MTVDTFNMCRFTQDAAKFQVITALLPIQMTPIPQNVTFPQWCEGFSAGRKGNDSLQTYRLADRSTVLQGKYVPESERADACAQAGTKAA